MVRKMEKINKEELMKKLNLTEEEMEKVAGGDIIDVECRNRCISQKAEVLATCLSVRYKVCVALAEDFENECLSRC